MTRAQPPAMVRSLVIAWMVVAPWAVAVHAAPGAAAETPLGLQVRNLPLGEVAQLVRRHYGKFIVVAPADKTRLLTLDTTVHSFPEAVAELALRTGLSFRPGQDRVSLKAGPPTVVGYQRHGDTVLILLKTVDVSAVSPGGVASPGFGLELMLWPVDAGNPVGAAGTVRDVQVSADGTTIDLQPVGDRESIPQREYFYLVPSTWSGHAVTLTGRLQTLAGTQRMNVRLRLKKGSTVKGHGYQVTVTGIDTTSVEGPVITLRMEELIGNDPDSPLVLRRRAFAKMAHRQAMTPEERAAMDAAIGAPQALVGLSGYLQTRIGDSMRTSTWSFERVPRGIPVTITYTLSPEIDAGLLQGAVLHLSLEASREAVDTTFTFPDVKLP